MKETIEQPITIYRTMKIEKTYDKGWSAEVVGLPSTAVSHYRYKENAIEASVDLAKKILGGINA